MRTQSPLPPTEDAKLEAAEWLARQRSNLRTTDDERGFQEWLAADPAHGAAFETLTAVWDVAGAYPRDMRGAPTTTSSSRATRRAVMAGLVAAPVAGVAYMTLLRPAEARTYITKIGEQRMIALPDDSHALLDTNSRIDMVFDRGMRVVTLQYGRANFAVVSDKTRPFVVKAAENQIVADASNFDVRCDGQKSCVMLFSGQASVNLRNEIRRLTPGERMMLLGSAVSTVDRPKPATVAAWHSGRTIFEDTRLAEAVAEMNRYSAKDIEIRGRNLGEKRISGVYRNGDSTAFANTVAALMPVDVRQTPGRVLLIENDDHPLTKK